MAERKQYFQPDEHILHHSHNLELRAHIALDLLHHWGAVAGKLTPDDDRAGRKNITLQEPKELVERCFQIADLFVDKAEARGEIKSLSASQEELHERIGKLRRHVYEGEFPKGENGGGGGLNKLRKAVEDASKANTANTAGKEAEQPTTK